MRPSHCAFSAIFMLLASHASVLSQAAQPQHIWPLKMGPSGKMEEDRSHPLIVYNPMGMKTGDVVVTVRPTKALVLSRPFPKFRRLPRGQHLTVLPFTKTWGFVERLSNEGERVSVLNLNDIAVVRGRVR